MLNEDVVYDTSSRRTDYTVYELSSTVTTADDEAL